MTTHLAMSMFATKEDYMEARIKELEAALSKAEVAKTAMAEALGPFAKLGLEPSPGNVWREVHVSDLRKAAEVLCGLRSEAEGKGEP